MIHDVEFSRSLRLARIAPSPILLRRSEQQLSFDFAPEYRSGLVRLALNHGATFQAALGAAGMLALLAIPGRYLTALIQGAF